MPLRLPLSAKILAWFFLNLLALAAVFALLFHAQFGLRPDWGFSRQAGQRLDRLCALVIGELNTTHPDDWHGVMERLSDAYGGLHIALVEPNGEPLIGAIPPLPEEVRQRIAALPASPDEARALREHRRRQRAQRQERRKPRAEAAAPKRPAPRRDGERDKAPPDDENADENADAAFLRTRQPTAYWLLKRGVIENPRAAGPLRVALVVHSPSLGMSGLILDPAPWLALAAGAVLFSILFWLPLLRGITRSLRQMRETTRQIAGGRFDVRVDARRGDELGALGGDINRMAGRLAGFVKGQQRFLGDIAHELCSPLAHLQMALGILEQQTGGPDGEPLDADETEPLEADVGEPEDRRQATEHRRSYVKTAGEKARQIAQLVNELLAFSRASFGPSAVNLAPVSVREIVEKAVQREATGRVKITRAIPENLAALADAELLQRALANLLRNAIRHGAGPASSGAEPVGDGSVNSDTPAIEITAVAEPGGQVAITIADHGPGVPEPELPRLFDAFYRLDSSRARETGGVGLGLTIVKTCVESCRGSVEARNRPPHGLAVTVRLPEG